MIKKVYDYLYENWLLSFLVLACLIVLLISGMVKICRYVVSTVEHPAYDISYFLEYEPHIIIYGDEDILYCERNESSISNDAIESAL